MNSYTKLQLWTGYDAGLSEDDTHSPDRDKNRNDSSYDINSRHDKKLIENKSMEVC